MWKEEEVTHTRPRPLLPALVVGAGLGLLTYVLIRPRKSPIPVMSPTSTAPRRLFVRDSVTIARPRSEVYAFWRDLSNLSRFMKHVKSITAVSERESLWTASLPPFGEYEWNAEIIADVPGERIAWQSLPGSDVDTNGEVRFVDTTGDRGTEVHVRFEYRPPAGRAGLALGHFITPEIEQLIREDVRRFKSLMETGEIPTVDGQSTGRQSLSNA